MDKTGVKIAIVTQSLANGGAERSCAIMSKMFYETGFETHIITVLDEIEYEYCGTLFNLGLLKSSNPFSRFRRMFALINYLKKHDFDWIIDNRTRTSSWSEWIISRWIYNPKKALYMVRSYNIKKYFPFNQTLARTIYKDSPYIIAVSDDIKEHIEATFGYQNVTRIYNLIDDIPSSALKESEFYNQKFIMSYGRIDDQVKNYSLLIDAYALSDLPKQNILLYIVGNGVDIEKLKQKINGMQLQDKIFLKPKMNNPFPMVKSAMFTVLTSQYEGFPRVLIESLALDTPVISVDCHSGPREIIQHKQNGLLVENHNEIALSQAMSQLIQDKALYQKLKENAAKSVSHLSSEEISKQWKKILLK
jgi:glycosyltransferase involved in cell wall biosynthesis